MARSTLYGRRRSLAGRRVATSARKLILKSHLSPGDIVMLTAAVRELHTAYPGQFVTDVRTTAPELWEHNPFVTPLDSAEPGVEVIDLHYPLIDRSNQAPYHFIHGYVQHLENCLDVRLPLTAFKGDIHLSNDEKRWMSQVEELGFRGRFWILMAGGKYDFTAKWWNPANYQAVVDHFRGRIQFVQCGDQQHWHPRLQGVIDLVGKTNIRQFVRLMYHATGVICPVTFAMHLAAAVETKPAAPPHRPCVVIAGGREPPHWEAYPHHQYIGNVGALACCQHGGCWKSRCQPVGDGDPKDQDLCQQPVVVSENLCIPRCMEMISAAEVIRRVAMYYEGGALRYGLN
ncbi:MAG TPA: glycosyltransferase family 9 protein [Pirellulales bacterium]|jgi:ADP-heptose:LPS heptosyltransferase|nr:glycosyltransferase family 9 protein [Pirellulales bacterium]